MAQSPLPHLLALGTAYSSIVSYHWQYPLLPILTGSWAFAFAAHLIVWLSWIYPHHVSELRHIPTVPGFPLWGQFFDIITQECGVPQRHWHEKYGPIIRYFFPFGSERLSVAEAGALRRITRVRPRRYPKPSWVRLWMSRVFGDGLLLAEGDEHSHQRKVLVPAFSSQAIKALLPIFWAKAHLLGDHWHHQIKSHGAGTASIEVLEWLSRATLDIIGQAGFGYDINSLDDSEAPVRVAYRLMFASNLWSWIFHVLRTFLPLSRFIPAQMNRNIDHARGIIFSLAAGIVRQHGLEIERKHNNAESDEGGSRNSQNIISSMLKHEKTLKEKGEKGLSFVEERDQITTFLGAGHDTTAAALAWSLHLLAKHHKVQETLRQEIENYLPTLFDELASFEADALAATDLDRLPYLNNVCREVLRYIPPVPLMVRESQTDDVLAGYHVPAGTPIEVVVNAINHLSMYWGDGASEFDPDRWDNLPDNWTPDAFMTFSHGPRACIGRRFLEAEMKVLLCALLSRYDFEPGDAETDLERSKVWRGVMRPQDGIVLRISTIERCKPAARSEAYFREARTVRRATF